MPWPTSPPTHITIISPLAEIPSVEATYFKTPTSSIFTAADPTPRTETHRAVSGPCSTDPVERDAQQAAVDAFLASYGTVGHPLWGIDPDGVIVIKRPINTPNQYQAVLAANGLTPDAT